MMWDLVVIICLVCIIYGCLYYHPKLSPQLCGYLTKRGTACAQYRQHGHDACWVHVRYHAVQLLHTLRHVDPMRHLSDDSLRLVVAYEKL